MTADVVAFPDRPRAMHQETLLTALVELHALITIDPILGASPSRIVFVLNPQARSRISACVDPADTGSRTAEAYALIAYDFPFALHQFVMAGSRIPTERAKAIISCSAGLQQESFARAAEAFGLCPSLVPCFDAAALKQTFFPETQETVTHLFRLSLA